jgi:hypothetical protein
MSGWKRIGIIVSIVWILVAYWVTFTRVQNEDIHWHVTLALSCEDRHQGTDPECEKLLHEDNRVEEHKMAAVVALAPVPIAWGLVYLILFLTRWLGADLSGRNNKVVCPAPFLPLAF